MNWSLVAGWFADRCPKRFWRGHVDILCLQQSRGVLCVYCLYCGRKTSGIVQAPQRRHVGPTESIYSDPWNNVDPHGYANLGGKRYTIVFAHGMRHTNTSGVYVEAYADGPAPIVSWTISDTDDKRPVTREVIPCEYVGRLR